MFGSNVPSEQQATPALNTKASMVEVLQSFSFILPANGNVSCLRPPQHEIPSIAHGVAQVKVPICLESLLLIPPVRSSYTSRISLT